MSAKIYQRVEGRMCDRAETGQGEERRIVYCKEYHQPKAINPDGILRSRYQRKSRCPSWAEDPTLRQALINDALVDSSGAMDSQGRPKRLWNAVDGFVFIGVSCNLPV